MNRFAAELLFVFLRFRDGQDISSRKVVERKIINLDASTPEEAFHTAMEYGREEEFAFEEDAVQVRYKFLGIVELISLEDETEEVVWWKYHEMMNPQDRCDDLIPNKAELAVFMPVNKPANKMKILSSR